MKKEKSILKITLNVNHRGKTFIEKKYQILSETNKRFYCKMPDSKSKAMRHFGKNLMMIPESIFRNTIHSEKSSLSFTVVTLESQRDEAVSILNEAVEKRFKELKAGFESLQTGMNVKDRKLQIL